MNERKRLLLVVLSISLIFFATIASQWHGDVSASTRIALIGAGIGASLLCVSILAGAKNRQIR